jgi:hypothetical protein
MSSDIRLEDHRISCIAKDILLDDPDRRGPENSDRPRRALVHDHQDGLTLNWDRDYPGGVTIEGRVHFPDAIQGAKDGHRINCVVKDVTLDDPDRRGPENSDRPRRALVHDHLDGLTLNWDRDYPGGVTIRGPVHFPDGIEEFRQLQELRSMILELQRRVEELEGR